MREVLRSYDRQPNHARAHVARAGARIGAQAKVRMYDRRGTGWHLSIREDSLSTRGRVFALVALPHSLGLRYEALNALETCGNGVVAV